MQLNRLLVIPARSGSKRIKNKNFKIFKGKPIIYYSIVTAIKARIFDKIVISTDNKKYINFLKNFNIDIFFRPKKLANDNSTIEQVLRNVVNQYQNDGIKFKEVWSLAPCSPLIKSNDLINASNILKKNKKKILLPITEYPAPLEWAFKLKKNKNLKPLKKNSYKIRSQDLSKLYYDTGNFVAIPFHYFLKNKIDFDKNYLGFVIPKSRSIDIDDLEDWKLAEKLYEKKN
jgi:CMP-N-acetylneuraminic acid synthetase